MALPRANWRGFLKLSLVSCPIALYPASSDRDRVSFNRLNKKTGKRLRQRMVDEGSGEEVTSEEIVKGFEFAKGNYVILDDTDLEAIKLESRRTIEIEEFVPAKDIDTRYIERPYYIVPEDEAGEEAFAVIHAAMKRRDVAGIGRVMLSSRERFIAVQPFDKGMIGSLLRYPYEVRGELSYFAEIKEHSIAPDLLEMADHLIDTKLGEFEPQEFTDRYETALRTLIEQKQKGVKIKAAPDTPAPTRVKDLMAALKESVARDRRPRQNSPRKASRKPARAAARRAG